MDNQGITAEQIALIHAQQAQQSCGLAGLFGGALGGLGAGLAVQNSQRSGFGSSPFGVSLSQQIAQQPRSTNVFAGQQSVAGLPKRCRKVRDYSEHLTRKEEKILPIDKR